MAECQHLNEQVAQCLQVTTAELADGAEVWLVQRGDRLDIQPLLAATRDRPRGIYTLPVSTEEQSHLSTPVESRSIMGVENSPLRYGLVASIAAGRLNGGEVAEVEFDHLLERLCRGSLAEAVG